MSTEFGRSCWSMRLPQTPLGPTPLTKVAWTLQGQAEGRWAHQSDSWPFVLLKKFNEERWLKMPKHKLSCSSVIPVAAQKQQNNAVCKIVFTQCAGTLDKDDTSPSHVIKLQQRKTLPSLLWLLYQRQQGLKQIRGLSCVVWSIANVSVQRYAKHSPVLTCKLASCSLPLPLLPSIASTSSERALQIKLAFICASTLSERGALQIKLA